VTTPAADLATTHAPAGRAAIDGRVIRARLRRIRELLSCVPALGRIDPPRLIDEPVTALAVERLLTLLVDLAWDCNSHVAVTVLGQIPDTYEESFDLAARVGMISPELAARLRPSATMREVLVHRCLEADPGQVALAVPLAPVLYGEYVRQVTSFVAQRAI
jgi:uncharacterized protein YutE (UPF0331/DUF86 family)